MKEALAAKPFSPVPNGFPQMSSYLHWWEAEGETYPQGFLNWNRMLHHLFLSIGGKIMPQHQAKHSQSPARKWGLKAQIFIHMITNIREANQACLTSMGSCLEFASLGWQARNHLHTSDVNNCNWALTDVRLGAAELGRLQVHFLNRSQVSRMLSGLGCTNIYTNLTWELRSRFLVLNPPCLVISPTLVIRPQKKSTALETSTTNHEMSFTFLFYRPKKNG